MLRANSNSCCKIGGGPELIIMYILVKLECGGGMEGITQDAARVGSLATSSVGKPLLSRRLVALLALRSARSSRQKHVESQRGFLWQFSQFTQIFGAVTFTWPEAEMKKLPSKQAMRNFGG